MKYLKLFNDAASYDAWKNSEEYVLPNVVFSKETGVVYYAAYVAQSSPNLVCVYDIVDISRETPIMSGYGTYAYTGMIVDGVEMDVDAYHQFDTVGLHTIEFVYDENYNTMLPGQGFEFVEQLVSVTIPNSVTSIGDRAFYACSNLTEITIPNSVTSIEYGAFYNCSSLTEIVIPDSVTSIKSETFYNCSSLTEIVIPDSVTSIGSYAFEDCNSLNAVYCKVLTPPDISSYSVFESNATDRNIYVPMESVDAYKSADGWSVYADYIVGYNF